MIVRIYIFQRTILSVALWWRCIDCGVVFYTIYYENDPDIIKNEFPLHETGITYVSLLFMESICGRLI